MSISDLPAELLNAVALQMTLDNKKNLRATSKVLSLALDPHVLTHIVLDCRPPLSQKVLGQLEDIPKSPRASLVRSLVIYEFHTDWPRFLQASSQASPGAHPLMISSRVRWCIAAQSSSLAPAAIINGLRTLACLKHLSVLPSASAQVMVPFHHLRDLHSISISIPAAPTHWQQTLECVVRPLTQAVINSPNLDTLKVFHDSDGWHRLRGIGPQYPCFPRLLERIPHAAAPLRLKHLVLYNDIDALHLGDCAPHLTALVSLEVGPDVIRPYQPRTPPPDVRLLRTITSLCAAQAFPRRLRVPWEWALAPALPAYLTAHPGLAQLSLATAQAYKVSDEGDDNSAGVFYGDVLPRHAETLTHLSVQPGVAGPWAFTAASAPGIAACTRLAALSVAINVPPAHAGLSHSERNAQVETVVKILLDTALRLPALRVLTITLAPPPDGRAGFSAGAARFSAWLMSTCTAIEWCRAVPASRGALEIRVHDIVYDLDRGHGIRRRGS
ncbi:hypothetical protein B0H15DRAFT_943585 [Mycena belliarum]|uniref:F-box domain-containing protein n=1 Tax=Mycena belliarum TaxID=1033014 RepID=A0AAD6XY83_9AGAR|nr:hypothetical protein B0H15DRAFT_943585 [Mycena belliae]